MCRQEAPGLKACPALVCELRVVSGAVCLPRLSTYWLCVQSCPLTEHLSPGSSCSRLVRGRRSQGWASGRGYLSPLGQELVVLQGVDPAGAQRSPLFVSKRRWSANYLAGLQRARL